MSTSGAACSQSTRSGHGGARNRRGRSSDRLTARQAIDLHRAAAFAFHVDLPLNRHITIHWQRAGVHDSDAAAATGRFLKLTTDHVRKRGGRIAAVWARENGDTKGSHVHILLHLPRGVSISARQREWVKRITGLAYVRRTIKTTRIGGAINAANAVPGHYLANLEIVTGYLAKGIDPAAGRALGLERIEPGGTVIGKRCGTTLNIGATARKGGHWSG